ncbi:MAG TPA: BrnA antitoxin family protein [Bosea sp. (in: a-proteobacteria)]|jgi:uncharacterized protein (DUF4415 family)|uniref:BrnA antitoxin family protein n=1 Tax=Bosea sp. (in: a-proteobacteria) TaxID=1871050 RepID=UPI002DDD81D6|nr:BrnA antitoxin family protein [Bosea sp. (in: a-proteobacteria)]HEV2556662.1 BrnA antitoxin family protein [Bosea sp. (in: a-proteobacteria)]
MKTKRRKPEPLFVDPDDAPPWTAEQFARAEISDGDTIIRPAQGTLTRPPGRPKLDDAKQVVTLRLPPSLIERYKREGTDWRARMADAIKNAVG